MAYPSPSPVNMNEPEKGFTANQPPQTRATGSNKIVDGAKWINSNATGKMNENRFTSLKPSHKTK